MKNIITKIKNMIIFLISKGANNYNFSLIGLVKEGHLDLVKLFISIGANKIDLAKFKAKLYEKNDIIKYLDSL